MHQNGDDASFDPEGERARDWTLSDALALSRISVSARPPAVPLANLLSAVR